MDENSDSGFSNRFVLSRIRPRNLPIENYAVEPWEKNTVEADMPDSPKRKSKTFYKSPSSHKFDNKNVTQKVFTFRKGPSLEERMKRAQTTRREWHSNDNSKGKTQVSINPYNINGAFIGQQPKGSQKSFKNYFQVKKQRPSKEKHRNLSLKDYQVSEELGRGSGAVEALKKRLYDQKAQEESRRQEYMHLVNESMEQVSHLPSTQFKRRSKVISVGYQKFASLRGLVKHRSASISPFNPL